MKIHTRELHPELTLAINGNEAWLSRIYGDFPAPSGTVAPKITGTLNIRLEEAGTVAVRGHIDFEPLVNCGRCEKLIPWPLSLPIKVRYSPVFEDDLPREKSLTSAELDEYRLNQQELDLEELINDTIQVNLPSRPVKIAQDEQSCAICLTDLGSALVFGPGESKPESPFAQLLKDPRLTKIKH